MPLIAKGISYLEIASDFQLDAPLLRTMSDLYRHSTFIAMNPNAKYGPLRHQQKCSLLNGSEYIFGNSLKGNKGSGKQVVFYPKSPEITVRGKDYISAYYAQNGFDLSQLVERVEVRLSSRYLSKFLVSITDLNDIQALGNIFRVAVGDTFTFRVLGKYYYDANRNRKSETVTLLEFADFSNESLVRRPQCIQDDTSDWRNRAEAKNAVLRFVARGNAQDWAQLVHISQEVRAPDEWSWKALFMLYALDYQGAPTPERKARIEMFR
ncbi:hypothetical protein [Hymenobacter sp. BRD67]|uniref:hypothetical protein n=1 Tax=Hymenobacter sp. BRD67 TaxID=2675877 RepID=UPI0015673E97|nr:hypothetical protein [Hymenobacter sp. BRD67]QKG52251.1 hypothetical protein GKZ67_06010 [Hymenobacter sp. BRD67]